MPEFGAAGNRTAMRRDVSVIMTLADRSCVPCRGGVAPLAAEEAETLRAQTPLWRLAEGGRRIERRFRTRSFADAFAFVGAVAALAEAEGHHPDIRFGWGYADLSLCTHVIDGLHANDFVLAAKIDRLAPAAPSTG